ncbi:MAG: response regulator [Myxococcota bacterium]|jgi:CheY-like chemotaxis protein|nr:response regulator [Myxococcota bacterium]
MARILVVDDDPDFASASRLVLESVGHAVVTAASPAEGLAVLAREQPDLLVLDVMMVEPDDGIVMAQSLRRSGNQIPILMLTSLPKVMGFTYVKDDEMIPVDEFLEKPVAPKRLIEAVGKLLGGGR